MELNKREYFLFNEQKYIDIIKIKVLPQWGCLVHWLPIVVSCISHDQQNF